MRIKEEFISLVDKKFFDFLISKSLIPFQQIEDRAAFLGATYDALHSNLSGYKPKAPRKYISVPKSKYVIRMVPTFELDDYCIYYFCIKVLENYIAENRVRGTFGGFRLGGKLREQESAEIEPSPEISINENAFNIFAWKKEYGEYQAKLRELAAKMGTEFQYAVLFDISNYYDCIRIDLLEKKIRQRVGDNSCDDEILLLLRFLKFWNSKYDPEKSIGIPQDEIGECSRILANFFLQDYDLHIFNFCEARGASYLRYADDQIVFAKSKDEAEAILYEASHKLFEESLNINSGKTKQFTNYQAFDDCYGFSIYEKLNFETQDVNQAFDLFVQKRESCPQFRQASVLKRLLHKKIRISDLQNQKRIKLLSYLWDEDFLLLANDHFMFQIYGLLKDEGEKAEYLKNLAYINGKTKFEQFKIHYEKFKRLIGI